MSRADCDACDEHMAKLEKDLKTYREASEAANRIIERQAGQIKKLQAALIIYRLTLTEAQKTEATPYESMTEKAAKAEAQLRAELPEEMA